MCKFTDYLQSPKLTLFVETKWAEWWDLFYHDGLRGKVSLCYTGLSTRFYNLVSVVIVNLATTTKFLVH